MATEKPHSAKMKEWSEVHLIVIASELVVWTDCQGKFDILIQ
jgi:hypothetical protein